jgi:hypothetical protein
MAPAQGKGLPMKKLITVALAACFLAMEGSQCLGFGKLWSRSANLDSRCDIQHTWAKR